MHLQSTNTAKDSLQGVVPHVAFRGADVDLASCTAEWNAVRPGDIYFAIAKEDADGHDQIDEAVARGAVAVVCEYPVTTSATLCVVEDSREAYARYCHALLGQPSWQIATVGVTGTNGKTVCTEMIGTILRQSQQSVAVLNSLTPASSAGDCWDDITPPALVSRLADAVASGREYAVVEASSRLLARRVLEGTQFDIACVTNVTGDHLHEHNSLEAYRKTKERIIKGLNETGLLLLNADDPYCCSMLGCVDVPALTYGTAEYCDIRGEIVEQQPGEQTMLLSWGSETIPVRTRMVGRTHLENCLASAAVAIALGIDLPEIARGIEAMPSLPLRQQRLMESSSVPVVAEYTANVHAVAAAIEAQRCCVEGPVACVIGGVVPDAGGEAFVQAATRMADQVFLTADLSAEGMMFDAGDAQRAWQGFAANLHVVENRGAAIHAALDAAADGSVLLLRREAWSALGVWDDPLLEFDQRAVKEYGTAIEATESIVL